MLKRLTRLLPAITILAGVICILLIVVAKPIVITQQPQSITVSDGTSAHFSVTAEGSSLAYQWQHQRLGSAEPWTSVFYPGSDTPHLTLDALPSCNTYRFRCRITDADGNEAYSDAALLTVTAKPLFITQQPQAITVTDGDTADFSVTADGSDPTYQWEYQYLGSEDPWNITHQSGNQGPCLSVEAIPARNNCQYRCKITDAYCNVVYTDPVLLTVAAKPIVITRQPQDITAADGATAIFFTTAEGSDLTYQWQFQYLNSEDSWYIFYQSGNNTPSLTLEAIPDRNNCQYRCQITDAYGTVSYSDPALLTVY